MFNKIKTFFLVFILVSFFLVLVWPALASTYSSSIGTIIVLSPPNPNGWDGWYREKPEIIITKDIPGILLYSWNGNSGPFEIYPGPFNAPEGINNLFYYSVNSTQKEEPKTLTIKVDSKAPVANLLEPENFKKINGIVSVIGTAKDDFIKKVLLEYGQGEKPDEFEIIKELDQPQDIESDIIARWDTHNLDDGIYRIRLAVIDQAGNTSFASKQVEVDNSPPATVINTPPSSNIRGDLCFGDIPEITLTRMEPGSTFYQWDKTSGVWHLYLAPIKGKDGFHTLYFYSVDELGNKEDVQGIKMLVDREPAKIIEKLPLVDTQDVSLNSPIVLTFDKAIDSNSFQQNVVSAKKDGTQIEGTIHYNPDNFQIIFSPKTGWPANSLIEVEINSEIMDMAGHKVATGDKWTFKSATAIDSNPPSIPENLQATIINENEVSLTWSKSEDNYGVKGYKIYRGNELIGIVRGITTFNDQGLKPESIYNHQVTAVDYSGNESAKSTPVRSVMPKRMTKGIVPPAPQGLKAELVDNGVKITWSPAAGDDLVAGYNIYRNDIKIKEIKDSTVFNDTQLVQETNYSYQVTAFSHDQLESEKSTAVYIVSQMEEGIFAQPHDNFNRNSDYCQVCHRISIKELRKGSSDISNGENNTVYELCFNCHDGSQSQSDILSQYKGEGKYSGHKTKKQGDLKAGTSIPCMVCHDVHSTSLQNFAFISDDLYRTALTEGYQDPQGDNKVSNDGREMCLICHRGNDKDGQSFILGIDLGAPPKNTKGHDRGDVKQSCLNCHDSPHSPAAGISEGGQDCNACHQEIYKVMSEKDRTYVHGFDNPMVKITSPSYDFIKQGTCTSICHVDHPHNQKSFNIHDGTNKNSAEDTDSYLCLFCHTEAQGGKNAVQSDMYTGSAHDYTPLEGTNSLTNFRGNCVKCHRDNRQGAGANGPHASDFKGILFAEGENLCFSCHPHIETKFQQFSQHRIGDDNSIGCYQCHNVHTLKNNLTGWIVTNPFSSNQSELYLYPKEATQNKTQEYDQFCLVCHDGSLKDAADIRMELENEESISTNYNNGSSNLHISHKAKGYGCGQCHDAHASSGISRTSDSIRIGALLRNYIELGPSYDAENQIYPDKNSCLTNTSQLNFGCHQPKPITSVTSPAPSKTTTSNAINLP